MHGREKSHGRREADFNAFLFSTKKHAFVFFCSPMRPYLHTMKKSSEMLNTYCMCIHDSLIRKKHNTYPEYDYRISKNYSKNIYVYI